MKKQLLLLLMTLLPMVASAYDVFIGGIYYSLNSSTKKAEVTLGNTKYTGSVTIPESVTYNDVTYSVTSIGDRAFAWCSSLTSVTIPNSVTEIGELAFYGCSGLTSVTIPNSVTNIGREAFSGCFFVSDSFVNNSSLKRSDNWGATLCDEETSDGVLIKNNVAVKCRPGVTSATIPNNVTSIGDHAFDGCSSLSSVTIPNSVTNIGSSAFEGCSSLSSVTIPNSVTNIGSSAFYGCNSLSSVTIPNSVTNIGSYAFCVCNSLTTIILESNSIVSKPRLSDNSMIIIFGKQVNNYIIGDAVTSIGDYVFYGCSRLKSVTIGNSVTSIGQCAFYDCSSLTSVTIPNNVTNIGGEAFSGCSGLTSIIIPNSVTNIGGGAFHDCSGLTSVQISDLSTWINIKFNNFGSNPLNYAHHLYLNGHEIKDLVIPADISSIGNVAFSGCSAITSVTLPSSVTSIGECAFQNCPRLRHIFVSSQTPADCIGTKTFYCNTDYVRSNYEVYDYAILHVPMGTKEEYAAAYEWRYFAKIKEDLDINGQVFYTTLSVNQAGTGYVKHYVKADEPYTLYIGSEEGMRINTVLYNGEDVTDMLVDGYYTTPNITRPSKIVVSFEQDPDGVANIPAENNLHIYGNDGSLFVSGIVAPQQMSVYTLNGMLINSQTLEGDARIKMSEGTYIVKIGKRTFKVLM